MKEKHKKMLIILMLCLAFSACGIEIPERVNTQPSEFTETEQTIEKSEMVIEQVDADDYERGHLPGCTGEMKLQPDECGEWKTVGYKPCEHGDPTVNDAIQKRKVYKIKMCDECGYTETETTTETQTSHKTNA